MQLIDLFRNFYRPRRLLGRSKSNDKQYEIQIRHYERFLNRTPETRDLNDDSVSLFLDWFHNGGTRSPETVNKAHTHLCALWRFAAQKRMVENWPDVSPMPVPERIPKAWQVEDMETIVDASAHTTGMIGRIDAAKFWVAFHRVLWCGGERTGAMLDLEWEWMNWRAKCLSVPGNVRKGRKAMNYWLDADAIEALREIRRPSRKLIFEWPMHPSTFWLHYKRLIRRAGFEPSRNTGPQKMRRSFASHLEAAGGNATQALRHSSRSVTLKGYIDPTIVGRPKHAELLPRIRDKNSPVDKAEKRPNKRK